ncbi:uncharacterized protein LOC123258153 [Drosophila ananassae]|uniref:uncharacterized protein LOC123258153 n=1 Tax=Drosophila ananassae TaxID=7217 RepID=UPI001CFF6FFA|nr:uncharacterized protein LOC123258153 [Drosophila ananassae]
MINVCHLGVTCTARALLDSGSEATFISERLFRILKLPYQSVQARVSGLNQAVAAQSTKMCHFQIGSPIKPRLHIEAESFVVPLLSGKLPSNSIPKEQLKDLPSFTWADPSFFESSQIDLLIGADILPSILLSGSRTKICGTLLGQETVFGWILSGPVSKAVPKSISNFSTKVSISSEAKLEKLLTKFWEVEDLPGKPVKESDSFCEKYFVQTTRRDDTGRYVVTLPFRSCDRIDLGHSRSIALAQFLKNESRLRKNPTLKKNMKQACVTLPFRSCDRIDLGHSRSIALAQFLKNESRLRKNPTLKEEYEAVIRDYLDQRHMSPIVPDSSGKNFYLPHHAFFKPDSTTTKVRVVFNASCPTFNGKSLNDILHPGPVLQSDLTLQVLRWRFFRFVFNADITKMYRQILVAPEHTPFQRILFRDANDQICDYELKTVTFGVNCAPFLAIRVLQQLAKDVRTTFPLASEIISTSMYVDDVLAGAHTKQSASVAIEQLRAALRSAGFPLRKWTSNSKCILKDIPKDHLLREGFLELDDQSTAKTLGIRWQANKDEFFFAPSDITPKAVLSKREVLSQIARLFDPAGWLAPFVIRAKIFMQEIWLQQLGWDDPLPAELMGKWNEFLMSYPTINQP